MIEVTASTRSPLGMSPQAFLRDFWQKRPLLIRRAFANFESPLTGDDLGGLACEDFALSRIVAHDPEVDRWTVRTGPFEEADFAGLPPSHWTLLVQDVDKWDADVAALLKPFDFLPSWRIDDVMVSYAEDGGSVGAHVDQYDVFLLQGQGRRRWQISTDRTAPTAFRDDVELRLLREFRPTHEWLLEPGDMLYLPPGVPHHGVAEDECLTFSIGMRAPAVGEMIADFAGFVAERLGESVRYADPGIAPAKKPGEIDETALDKIESTLRDSLAVDASLLRGWFGAFITRYRAAHEALPPARALSAAEFTRRFKAGESLQSNPWSRFAWSKARNGATLYVAGESFHCTRRLAERLCLRDPLTVTELGDPGKPALDLLLTLLNAGHMALGRIRSKR